VADESKPEDDADEVVEPSEAPEEAAAEKPEGSSRSGAVMAVIAMLVAIGTLGASAWMWRNPQTAESAQTKAPVFTEQERNEAKAKVCAAYDLVGSGVASTSSLQAPGGPEDIMGTLAVAANAKLALFGGGQYLLARLDPATPTDLAEATSKFANTLMDVGLAAIAQVPTGDPAQEQRLKDAEAQNTALQGLCE
jgi:hypothetical protein